MTELNQSDWEGVFYDAQEGEFVTINVDNGDPDTVTLTYYGDDVSEDIDIDDFAEARDEYYRVPDYTVENPDEVIQTAVNDYANEVSFGESIPLQFAMEFTEVTPTNDD